MNCVINVEQLQTFYVLDVLGKRKTVKAVNDVTLSIPENEIYGIAGESGCGKTTLLKAFLPLLSLLCNYFKERSIIE